ncbi:hypothetical protein PC121_g5488 [Phytophthora cactorum]|nr:hypothetical protein PC120_g7514 [Phytophthora cactorum]KAG3084096.1 hypothetical protein PC121_g5488 [Phytophthora cactorum]
MAADLVDRIRAAVLRQQEEAVHNYFTRVDDMHDFLTDHAPSPGVEITVKMVCLASERLTGNNGTRVTLIDYLSHGNFESLSSDLSELKAINRKPFVAQFRPGTVYEFKQVHNVGFYAEVPKGSVQMEECVAGRVIQKAPPTLKRKGEHVPSGRKGKARALAFHVTEEEKDGELDAGGASITPRTRGTVATRV